MVESLGDETTDEESHGNTAKQCCGQGWELGGSQPNNIINDSSGDCSESSFMSASLDSSPIAHFCGLTCRTCHGSHATTKEAIACWGCDRDGQQRRRDREYKVYLQRIRSLFICFSCVALLCFYLSAFQSTGPESLTRQHQPASLSQEDAGRIWFPAAAPPRALQCYLRVYLS